jgi:hypothetical protein
LEIFARPKLSQTERFFEMAQCSTAMLHSEGMESMQNERERHLQDELILFVWLYYDAVR